MARPGRCLGHSGTIHRAGEVAGSDRWDKVPALAGMSFVQWGEDVPPPLSPATGIDGPWLARLGLAAPAPPRRFPLPPSLAGVLGRPCSGRWHGHRRTGDLKGIETMALLQRLAAVRGRLSLCADQAAAAKWWLSMPMASVSAEGPMPKALSTRRTSQIGRASCRARVCQYVQISVLAGPLKKNTNTHNYTQERTSTTQHPSPHPQPTPTQHPT